MIDEKKLIQKKKQLEAEFESLKKKGAALEKTLADAGAAYNTIVKKMGEKQTQWKLIDELLKNKK